MSQGSSGTIYLPPTEVNAYKKQTYMRLSTGHGCDASPLNLRSRIEGYTKSMWQSLR